MLVKNILMRLKIRFDVENTDILSPISSYKFLISLNIYAFLDDRFPASITHKVCTLSFFHSSKKKNAFL